jgi:hypothetical protein
MPKESDGKDDDAVVDAAAGRPVLPKKRAPALTVVAALNNKKA